MNTDFEDKYFDVLQKMELTIVQVYRQYAELSDYQVDKALDSLIRAYQAEQRGKPSPAPKFGQLDQRIYDDVREVCRECLGLSSVSKSEEIGGRDALVVDEIIACLKRIRQSIRLWTKEYGRKGYLDYITQFLP